MADTLSCATMDLSHLLSPPESKPRDSFSQHTPTPAGPSQTDDCIPDNTLPPISIHRTKDIMGKLPSPPVTPANRALQDAAQPLSDQVHEDTTSGGSPMKDPLLFPNDAATTLASSQPLFAASEQTVPNKVDVGLDAIVTQHMAMHMNTFKRNVSQPTRDEYLLAASCVPIVSEKYAQNPRKWLRQERRILDERFGGANRVWKRPTNKTLAKLAPAPLIGVKKPVSPSRTVRQPRAPRTPKRTPQSKLLHSFDGFGLASPKRVIGTSREDTDFAALPDHAPPISTLPKNNSKVLKADWKGQILDLSHDPHRDLLHEAEVNLAATLRLSCATYLCSKRRIFMARLDALRVGKEFRKTDSQQACKIDVNKASKLWAAYDKVGWFRPEHFAEYL